MRRRLMYVVARSRRYRNWGIVPSAVPSPRDDCEEEGGWSENVRSVGWRADR